MKRHKSNHYQTKTNRSPRFRATQISHFLQSLLPQISGVLAIIIYLLRDLIAKLCDKIQPDSYWYAFMNVDRVVIGLLVVQVMIYSKEWIRVFFQCVLGLIVVDLVDRFLFDNTTFGPYDLIGILLAFAMPIFYKYRKPPKNL